MVFSNLDLRLDVLERELGLPFTFVSGHIHELHINVPWTRLNSDPIVITINTIECVLRLPDSSNAGASPESSEASFRSQELRSKARRLQQQQDDSNAPPPGYVQSLINKIISNVKIVCNNLILKYVEDDIVLSLNTRWLCLTSANALWEPAFVDLSLPDLVLRKLLQVKDMTICLDRRDISGRINEYQEPFLYRCSLNVHAAWVYDSLTNKVPRVTRYDIRSQRMDFSLTDTQLPMFLRIFNLLLSLYYGDFNLQETTTEDRGADAKPDSVKINIPPSDFENEMPQAQQGHEAGHSSSWSGWAWTVGSTVGSALLPIYWEDEDDEDNGNEENGNGNAPFQLWKDKIFHLGLYIDEASLVLKLTEKLPKDMGPGTGKVSGPLHTSRLSFSPFLKVVVNGVFQDIKSVGVHTVNVQNGISYFQVVPLGDCACGERDTLEMNLQENEAEEKKKELEAVEKVPDLSYFSGGKAKSRSFLRGSFFVDFGDEDGTCMERKCSYDIFWDTHLEQVTEDSMLERTPAMAFDLLYQLDLPYDFDSENLSVISDLENSPWNERFISRMVLGPASVKICSGSVHRIGTIAHFLSKYDYPPYRESSQPVKDTLTKGKASKADSNETMEESAKKVRVYQLTAINPSLFVYAADHPCGPVNRLDIEACLKRRAKCLTHPGLRNSAMPSNFTNGLSIVIALDCLDSRYIVPMYPVKLSTLVTIHQPRQLSDNCYSTVDMKLMQLSCKMAMSSKNQSITCLQPSNIKVKISHLSFEEPDLSSSQQPQPQTGFVHLKTRLDVENLKCKCSRPQWLLLNYLTKTWTAKTKLLRESLDPILLHDAMMSKLAILAVCLKGGHLEVSRTKISTTLQYHCADVSVYLGLASQSVPILSTVPLSAGNSQQGAAGGPYPASPGRALNRRAEESRERNWLRLDLQLPNAPEHSANVLSMFALQIGEIYCNLDPKLNDWVSYSSSRVRKVSSSMATPPPAAAEKPPMDKKASSGKRSLSKGKTKSSSHKTPQDGGTTIRSQSEEGSNRGHGGDLSELMTEFLTNWSDVFNALLVQVQIEQATIITARKSLTNCSNLLAKSHQRHVKDSLEAVKSSTVPFLCLISPLICLENVAHKPQINQFLSKTPFCMPENVWNPRRDNLPWTLKLTDFSLSYNQSGSVESMLEPITTSCTLALNGKDRDVGFALCVHADMSNFKATLTEEQLQLIISIFEKSLQTLTHLQPDLFNSEATHSRHNVRVFTFRIDYLTSRASAAKVEKRRDIYPLRILNILRVNILPL